MSFFYRAARGVFFFSSRTIPNSAFVLTHTLVYKDLCARGWLRQRENAGWGGHVVGMDIAARLGEVGLANTPLIGIGQIRQHRHGIQLVRPRNLLAHIDASHFSE